MKFIITLVALVFILAVVSCDAMTPDKTILQSVAEIVEEPEPPANPASITASDIPVEYVEVYHFALIVDGLATGYFTSVDGLGSENEIVEQTVVAAGGQTVVRQIPGRLVYPSLILSRGITTDKSLWDWRQEIIDRPEIVPGKNITINMFDSSGAVIAGWDLTAGWPAELSAAAPAADDANYYAIETLVIAHEGCKRTR